jgi:hypothetical protein
VGGGSERWWLVVVVVVGVWVGLSGGGGWVGCGCEGCVASLLGPLWSIISHVVVAVVVVVVPVVFGAAERLCQVSCRVCPGLVIRWCSRPTSCHYPGACIAFAFAFGLCRALCLVGCEPTLGCRVCPLPPTPCPSPPPRVQMRLAFGSLPPFQSPIEPSVCSSTAELVWCVRDIPLCRPSCARFWTAELSGGLKYYKCPVASACLQGVNGTRSTCLEGYKGLLCDTCSVGCVALSCLPHAFFFFE